MARSSTRALAACALAVVACSDNSGNSDAGPDAISPNCLAAMDHSDLTWIQDKVFQPSCAGFRDCHQGAAVDAAHLSLERGQSHIQLVGIAAEFTPPAPQSNIRVVPGDPANSYLMVIIGQYTGARFEDRTMPYNSELLCKEKRDAIERWILAGAPPEP